MENPNNEEKDVKLIKNKLNEAIKDIMRQTGCRSQNDLFKKAGVSRHNWFRYLRTDNTNVPKREALVELIEGLHSASIDVAAELEKNLYESITIEGRIVLGRACPVPPERPDHFGGRSAALEELKKQLASNKLVVLSAVQGMSGIGKTTLAAQLANELYYEDKVFRAVIWQEVGRKPNVRLILHKWANLADKNFVPYPKSVEELANEVKGLLEQLIDMRCEHCSPARTLVVLDDIWSDGVEVAAKLRAACPNEATVLITTRSQEVATVLGYDVLQLEPLSQEEGLEIFKSYNFPLSTLELQRGLIELLGGHTLALTIAIKYIQIQSNIKKAFAEYVEQIKRGLPGNLTFAKLKLEKGDTKDNNLRLSLSYNYEQLPEPQRLYYRFLGVLAFDQPFSSSLVKALWLVEEEEKEEIYNNLRLVALIEKAGPEEDEDAEEWYKQHPLLHKYAHILLENNPQELEVVRRRYAQFITSLAGEFSNLAQEEWQKLNSYIPHIEAVGTLLVEVTQNIDTVSENDNFWLQTALTFASNMRTYLEAHQELHRLDWFVMGLRIARIFEDKIKEADFLQDIGTYYIDRSEFPKALEHYEQALSVNETIGSKRIEATTYSNIGQIYWQLWKFEEALKYHKVALPLWEELNDLPGLSLAFTNVGVTYHRLGNLDEALTFLIKGLELRENGKDRRTVASSCNNIGAVYFSMERYEQSLEYYHRALKIFTDIGELYISAVTRNNIGKVSFVLGNYDEAEFYYKEAITIHRKTSSRLNEAGSLANLGQLYLSQTKLEAALENFEQALQIFQETSNILFTAKVSYLLGKTHYLIGTPETAKRYLDQASTIFEELGNAEKEHQETMELLQALEQSTK